LVWHLRTSQHDEQKPGFAGQYVALDVQPSFERPPVHMNGELSLQRYW
jgi:hypothetical protein